jgi:hypothetical protein
MHLIRISRRGQHQTRSVGEAGIIRRIETRRAGLGDDVSCQQAREFMEECL